MTGGNYGWNYTIIPAYEFWFSTGAELDQSCSLLWDIDKSTQGTEVHAGDRAGTGSGKWGLHRDAGHLQLP